MVLLFSSLGGDKCISRDRTGEPHGARKFVHLVAEGPIVLVDLECLGDGLPVGLVLNDVRSRHHVKDLHVGVGHGDLGVTLHLLIELAILEAECLALLDLFLYRLQLERAIRLLIVLCTTAQYAQSSIGSLFIILVFRFYIAFHFLRTFFFAS